MKRIGCLVAIFLFSLPLFAENTSVHAFHFSFPIEASTFEAKKSHSRKYFDFGDTVDEKSFGAFINWNKLIVKESRLSFVFGVGAGFMAMKVPDISSDFFIGGLVNAVSGKFGVGFAPLKTEKYLLAVHGFSELKGGVLDCDASSYLETVSDELHYTVTEVALTSGVDGVFIVKLGERLSLFSGLDISTVIFGGGSLGVSRDGSHSDSDELTYRHSFSNIAVVPRIGLCFGF